MRPALGFGRGGCSIHTTPPKPTKRCLSGRNSARSPKLTKRCLTSTMSAPSAVAPASRGEMRRDVEISRAEAGSRTNRATFLR